MSEDGTTGLEDILGAPSAADKLQRLEARLAEAEQSIKDAEADCNKFALLAVDGDLNAEALWDQARTRAEAHQRAVSKLSQAVDAQRDVVAVEWHQIVAKNFESTKSAVRKWKKRILATAEELAASAAQTNALYRRLADECQSLKGCFPSQPNQSRALQGHWLEINEIQVAYGAHLASISGDGGFDRSTDMPGTDRRSMSTYGFLNFPNGRPNRPTLNEIYAQSMASVERKLSELAAPKTSPPPPGWSPVKPEPQKPAPSKVQKVTLVPAAQKKTADEIAREMPVKEVDLFKDSAGRTITLRQKPTSPE